MRVFKKLITRDGDAESSRFRHNTGSQGSQRTRTLSAVLLKVTLLIALAIGVLAASVQVMLDLQQQKQAVEDTAGAFLDNVTPSAALAAYNYQDAAARDVITGLFTQRAIRQVRIINGNQVMAERERELTPTLPGINLFSQNQETILRRDLINPEAAEREVIGEISIIVDRSIVPPDVAGRLLSYFVLSTLKNLLFGMTLVALVYTALTRHIVQIAEAAAMWEPGGGAVTPPPPPGFLLGTEIEVLGNRIREMSGVAENTIQTLESASKEVIQNNNELSARSDQLSEAVQMRTKQLDEANIALRRQADRDSLTGVYNRGSFDRWAQNAFSEAVSSHGSVALMMVDLDQFKPFNDHYGHLAGDNCLIQVAKALDGLIDGRRSFLARYGGEEFICLMQNAALPDGEEMARKIHQAISALAIPHERSNAGDTVSASIGLACETGADLTSVEDLIAAADAALYEAKYNGRNRTVVSSVSIRQRVKARREIVSDLLLAIEQQQFEPFFQFQFDARTHEVIGMEALARWRKPSGEILGPGEFMPAAEENDLVRLIDAIIFDKCAAFLKEARTLGVNIPSMSINLSEDHLKDDGLVGRLLAMRDASSSRVEIELLETTALDDPSDQLMWTVDKIRDLGFGIEIDDFGTGKASIMSLTTLRPSRLKIARELVVRIEEPENRKLLSCVLEIARTLEIGVVAEGVETEAQRQILIDLGCFSHQGFLYARPQCSKTIIETLLDRNCPKRTG